MKNMFYLHIKYDQKLSINYHKFKDKIYTRKSKKKLTGTLPLERKLRF